MLRTLPLWFKAVLVALLTFLTYIILHIYGTITPPALLYIADTNQSQPLLIQLQQQGVPLNILDYRLTKRYPSPKAGWVRFDSSRKISRETLIRTLHEKPREKTRRIVMYSANTLEDFATITGKQTRLSPQKIIEQYHHYSPYPDGGIIAGYYRIPYRTTPDAITYYMVSSSEKRFLSWAEKYLGSYDTQGWNRILIIASIIQKETQKPKEMPLISSVIHNRLKKGMKLQLDATLNYGKYSHQIVTPARIKEDKSRYNTYRYKGLPPHPIGSATKEAILAALQPANTDYLYFMLADNGSHNFAVTYEKHLANIRWYKAQKEQNRTEAHHITAPTKYPNF
jgi:UPF0755 protein